MNVKGTMIAGSLLGLLGVALGAFGAHALKPILIESGRLDTFELAVRYQFYHAFAILITGVIQHLITKSFNYPALFFLLGTAFFSGSLYAICFTKISALAFLTPVGGVLLIFGWALLLIEILKKVK